MAGHQALDEVARIENGLRFHFAKFGQSADEKPQWIRHPTRGFQPQFAGPGSALAAKVTSTVTVSARAGWAALLRNSDWARLYFFWISNLCFKVPTSLASVLRSFSRSFCSTWVSCGVKGLMSFRRVAWMPLPEKCALRTSIWYSPFQEPRNCPPTVTRKVVPCRPPAG